MIGIQQRFLCDELDLVQQELERIEMGCCAQTIEETQQLTLEYQQRQETVLELLGLLEKQGDVSSVLANLGQHTEGILQDYVIGLSQRLQQTIRESTVEYALADIEQL